VTVLRKLAWLFTRRRREAELAEELRFHLEEEAADREAAGLPAQAARLAARRDLGNPTAVAEHTRAAWSWRWLEELAQDLRYAARAMAAAPAFTTLALLSLALGIGANTAIFSFMDAILLRSLPVADPQSLIVLRMHTRQPEVHGSDFHDGSFMDPVNGFTNATFSYPAFEFLRRDDRFFSSVFGYQSTSKLTVSVQGQAQSLEGEYVTGDYFRALGVPPAAGRLIVPDDDRAGAPATVVVTYAFAANRLGGAATAPGQTILVRTIPFTVIGVTPREFFGADPGAAPDLFFPMHANLLLERFNNFTRVARRYHDAGDEWVNVMARLRPGVTGAQVQAALSPAFHEWIAVNNHRRNRDDLPTLAVSPGAAGLDGLRRQYSKPLFLLMTLVVLILALSCANIANLLLARCAARRREMSIRLSIGAGRGRLVRQLLTESLLLAFTGGALGVSVAFAGVRFLTLLLSDGRDNFTLRADLNGHVLAAAVALSLLTGIVFGLAPALQSTRVDLTAGLRQSRTGSPGRLGLLRFGLGRALVVSQVAIALLIVVAAGLFVRTLSNLESIDIGFSRGNVLTLSVNARQAGHRDSEILPLYEKLRDRFAALPGVRSAGLSSQVPLGMGRSGTMVALPGGPQKGTGIIFAGPGFFSTMQIPILLGRPIDAHDRSGVAVVDENFVRTFFGGADPIGRTLTLPTDTGKSEYQIIGVAGNIRYGNLYGKSLPFLIYVPYSQPLWGPLDSVVFELRTAGNALGYVPAVRDIVRQADPNLPLSDIKTQAALIDETIAQQITFARLSSALALLALAIAAVGLYGTVSYNVARRTAEIGIRMALGAPRRRVVWNVLREVLLMAMAGIAISLPVALAASKLVDSFLFGLKRYDPFALSVAALVLFAAALVAGFIPARRASRIDPMRALRHE
jgi:macrolide transport system ATP-binding/permease protein